MEIITLTLNPAFDLHCRADGFKPYRESFVELTEREAGGKGVNISRALQRNGRKSRAVIIAGNENGAEFCEMLRRDSLSVEAIVCDGRIRENLTLHERKNPETRISFGGFSVNADTIESLKRIIESCGKESIITLTGSIPRGISSAEVLSMLSLAKAKGAKIIIDSRSVELSDILSFKPWLIKPNQGEIEAYVKKSIETIEDGAKTAREIFSLGIENVMISLGEGGAVLACKGGVFYAKAPAVKVKSTVGAGDSAIAGFLDGFLRGEGSRECLARAVAFGTAACMREGTQPPIPEDVSILLSKIEAVRIP